MTALVYLLGISVTVSWSVWAFQRAPEPHKSISLFVPAGLLVSYIVLSFRSILDVPLLLLQCVVFGIARVLLRPVEKASAGRGPAILFTVIWIISILLAVAGFTFRNDPYVHIYFGRIQGLMATPERLFAWATEGSLTSRVNQLFIALVSYIPVAVFRMAMARIQRAEMRREIEMLREEIRDLEKRLPDDSAL